MKVTVNGQSVTLDVDEQKPLLWFLREDLGVNGPKYGCGIGACGCCSVLIDGVAARSCIRTMASVAGQEITTIEGLNDELGRAIKQAWIDERVSQCGYCQPGQIIGAYFLLAKYANPDDEQIANEMLNLCRCGTYQRIAIAIKRVASLRSVGTADPVEAR